MFRILSAMLVLACGAIPASASLTTYTTLSTFTAATLSQTFQSITFPSGNDGTSYTDTSSGVVFSDSAGIGSSFLDGIASPNGWPSGSSLEATNCSSGSSTCTTTLTITLPSAVTSVSMDLGLQSFNSFQLTVSSSGGGTFNQNLESGGLTTGLFYGFVSDTPFSSFT